MRSFWNDLPTPFFALAPLEAVSDVVFRHVVAVAARPDIFFTEFTNATGWAHAGDKAIGGRLVKTDDEHPIVAQLWGSDPDSMAKLAAHCRTLGFDGIDINTGCPDDSAIKSGSGAAMIKTPGLVTEMVEAAKQSGLPVSLKTRLGYSSIDERHAWIDHLLKQNLAALTVHLRTKKEMSKVDAHWELMPEIVSRRDTLAPKTLIIGNGDVKNRQDGLKLATETGVDGIMIGRGIFTNPFAFEEIPRVHGRQELLNLLHIQLDLYDKYHPQTLRPFDTLKRFFKIYVRDFEAAAELRDKLMHARSTEEVRDIIISS